MVYCYYSKRRGKHTRLCMRIIHPLPRGDCIDRSVVAYPLAYDLRFLWKSVFMPYFALSLFIFNINYSKYYIVRYYRP